MRIIILSGTCILELALFIFCLIKKSNNKKKKFIVAAITFILLIGTIYVLLFPSYKLPAPSGEYEVKTVNYFFTDKSRKETYSEQNENRTLQVEFWYPANFNQHANCPLIVFSHGSFGVKESNESLYNELASHGYVVCAIDHTYQCFSTTDEQGNTIKIDKGFLKEVMKQDTKNKVECYHYFEKWMSIRTDDVNFVLDTILEKTALQENEEYSLINTDKIGLIGHSLGGSDVLGVGRMRDDISVVISLEAPFMCDIIGATEDKFLWNKDPYPIPVLNVYSDSSWSKLGVWEQYAKNYQLLKNPEDNEIAYSSYIEGAGHLTLTDLTLSCPLFCVINGQNIFTDGETCIIKLNKICLDFFDTYLKNP